MKQFKIINFIYSLSLAVLVLFLCTKCPKEPEPITSLPPATQEGKNVVACKINDTIWVNKGALTPLRINSRPFIDGSALEFTAMGKFGNNISELRFIISGATTTGVYLIGKALKKSLQSKVYYNYVLFENASTDTTSNGYFEILKFDSASKIISGKFNFNINKSNGQLHRKFSEGIFDIKILQ